LEEEMVVEWGRELALEQVPERDQVLVQVPERGAVSEVLEMAAQ